MRVKRHRCRDRKNPVPSLLHLLSSGFSKVFCAGKSCRMSYIFWKYWLALVSIQVHQVLLYRWASSKFKNTLELRCRYCDTIIITLNNIPSPCSTYSHYHIQTIRWQHWFFIWLVRWWNINFTSPPRASLWSTFSLEIQNLTVYRHL